MDGWSVCWLGNSQCVVCSWEEVDVVLSDCVGRGIKGG